MEVVEVAPVEILPPLKLAIRALTLGPLPLLPLPPPLLPLLALAPLLLPPVDADDDAAAVVGIVVVVVVVGIFSVNRGTVGFGLGLTLT